MPQHTKTMLERLNNYVADPGTGCWIWCGAMFRGGYGNVRHEGRNVSAHRAMYEAVVGLIPEGLDLDHLCRTPACIRPSHLEPVSRGENLRRGTHWWDRDGARDQDGRNGGHWDTCRFGGQR
jgi:HNH endonuclease